MGRRAAFGPLPLLLVLGATLCASLPLLPAGLPQTHDGLFHYFRLAALDEALRQGCWYPRWFPDLAFGYGQPVLSFYSPALYYLGAGLTAVGMGAATALKVAVALSFLLSGMGAYGLARRYTGRWAAAAAGAGYVLFTYRVGNVYVRGAFAEHLGLALVPLVFLAGQRALDGRGWPTALACLWAAVILAHNLTALMLVPAWLAYLVWAGRGRMWRLPEVGASLGAGGALTAFYWLPVVQEVKFVGLGNTFSTDAWQRHLVSAAELVSPALLYRYYPHQGTAHDYPLGVAALVLAGLSLVAMLASRWRAGWRENRLWFYLLLLGVSVFLQWRASAWLWQAFPLMGYLQFPWRLLGFGALGWAMLLGGGVEAAARLAGAHRGAHKGLYCGVGAVLLTALTSLAALPRAQVSPGGQDDWVEAMWRHDQDIGQVGATWTAEYVPVWVTVDRSAMHLAPVESDRPPHYTLPPGTEVTVAAASHSGVRLEVCAPEAFRLSWHAFYFPGWLVQVDGRPQAAEPFTDLGLASAEIEPGTQEVAFRFGSTWPREAGRVLSLLAASALAVAGAGGLGLGRRLALGVAAGLVVAFCTGCRPVVHTVQGVWAPFEEQLALTGWALAEPKASPGKQLTVDLYWLALTTPQEDYKVFVHLVDKDGRVVAQSDGDPGGGFTPPRRLQGGEIMRDRRRLSLPAELPAGEYALHAGLYRWPEVANLRVSAGDYAGAERVPLSWVDMTP